MAAYGAAGEVAGHDIGDREGQEGVTMKSLLDDAVDVEG